MNFTEDLAKQLEPFIIEIVNKHDEDLFSAFDEILDNYADQMTDYLNKIDEVSNKSSADSVSDPIQTVTIDDVKADTRQILGTLNDIKSNLEEINSANDKVISELSEKYEVSDEKINKKLSKLEKTAKNTESNTNKTKDRLKKIGKWLTGFLILFFAGDVIKDLVVAGFDKLIHSDFARRVKSVIDQTFPKFGAFLSQASDWWEKRAKPWLDKHTFAEFFSKTFDQIANLWDFTKETIWPFLQNAWKQIIRLFGPIINKDINEEYRKNPDEFVNNPRLIDDATYAALRKAYPDNRDLAKIILYENQQLGLPESARNAAILDKESGAILHLSEEQLAEVQTYGGSSTRLGREIDVLGSHPGFSIINQAADWAMSKSYRDRLDEIENNEGVISEVNKRLGATKGDGSETPSEFMQTTYESLGKTLQEEKDKQMNLLQQSTNVNIYQPTYNVQEPGPAEQ